MRIIYFDCFSGISGDMTVGAFLDAGLKLGTLSRALKRLPFAGYRLAARRVKRLGIVGTKFDCVVTGAPHRHRSLKDITRLIDRSSLGKRTKALAGSIFETIGRAEAKLHGVKKTADVTFHEIGAIDSIVDVVGTAIAMEELGIDEAHASAVNFGRGFIRTMHGTFPVPSPASLEILRGVPAAISTVEAELVTPTGAGILKTLARSFGAMPAMNIARIGYGAGGRELAELPNMLRIITGEKKGPFIEDTVVIIEANIDDMNPQYFEHIFERLFAEGALDVAITPVQMKKSRPAFTLTVIADPARLDALGRAIFGETTTSGVRFHEARRFKLARRFVTAKTRYGDVPVKVMEGPGGILTVSPEYAACSRIARAEHVPVKLVYDAAKTAAKF